jgi:hypothetical protein
MFGVPIDGPTWVLCHNEGVVNNSSIPEVALIKKANAINDNKVREAVAKDISVIIKGRRTGKNRGYFDQGDFWRQAQLVAQPHSVVSAPTVQGCGASRPGNCSQDLLCGGAFIRVWWYIGILFVDGLRCLMAIIVRGD